MSVKMGTRGLRGEREVYIMALKGVREVANQEETGHRYRDHSRARLEWLGFETA